MSKSNIRESREKRRGTERRTSPRKKASDRRSRTRTSKSGNILPLIAIGVSSVSFGLALFSAFKVSQSDFKVHSQLETINEQAQNIKNLEEKLANAIQRADRKQAHTAGPKRSAKKRVSVNFVNAQQRFPASAEEEPATSVSSGDFTEEDIRDDFVVKTIPANK